MCSSDLGGWVDSVVMRVVDILLSVPNLLLAVSIAAILGQTPFAVMIAIGVAQVPVFARLLRSSMLTQKGSDYVLAAQTLGLSRGRITMSHVLPNSLGPVIVQATLTLATAVIDAAALSFLGLGGGAILFDQRPAVGGGDLIIVRVNLGEGEETVAVSAVIHERCLQRGFDPRDLCQVDVASQLALVQGLEIKVVDPRSIGHDHPSFLGVGGVDQHLLCHVSCFRAALRVLPCRG